LDCTNAQSNLNKVYSLPINWKISNKNNNYSSLKIGETKLGLKCNVDSYECIRCLKKLPDVKWKTKYKDGLQNCQQVK